MIILQMNQKIYEADIYSLVKAFCPQEQITVKLDKSLDGKQASMIIQVRYLEEKAEICFLAEDKVVKQAHIKLDEDFSENKNRIKSLIYGMLCEYFDRTLPWGTLTGIRPTKRVAEMFEDGFDEQKITDIMHQTFQASPEKIKLSMEIAKRELNLLKNIDYKKGYSLYVGIPFCPTTCLYCSFTSFPLHQWKSQIDRYLETMFCEIDYISEVCVNRKLHTIYIGGGTPTTLEPEQLDRLCTYIKGKFSFAHLKEYTVEAGRPDSITEEKLKVLLKHGVTRISINPQTMQDRTLRLIGRRHTAEQTVESFKLARKLGFHNINMDLIVGLPGENCEDLKNTLEQILQLSPDNLTVHSLALKRAAFLNIYKEQYKNMEVHNTAEMMEMTRTFADHMQLQPYYLYRQKNIAGNFENVGYAREGTEGLYNIFIMEERQTIVAVGAGASSKIIFPDGKRLERVENVKDVTHYLERVEEMIERKQKYRGLLE